MHAPRRGGYGTRSVRDFLVSGDKASAHGTRSYPARVGSLARNHGGSGPGGAATQRCRRRASIAIRPAISGSAVMWSAPSWGQSDEIASPRA